MSPFYAMTFLSVFVTLVTVLFGAIFLKGLIEILTVTREKIRIDGQIALLSDQKKEATDDLKIAIDGRLSILVKEKIEISAREGSKVRLVWIVAIMLIFSASMFWPLYVVWTFWF